MSEATRRPQAWALPLLGYALVTSAFFAPLGAGLLRQQIGTGDNLESLWNAWWIGRSLLQLENPWFADVIFAPEGTPLVWHSLAPISSASVSLLSNAVPVNVAYNAVVMAALPVAGLSAWALGRHITGDAVASFVGGLAFMLSPFVTSKTLGHLDLLYGGLLPLFYLALLRTVDAPVRDRARKYAWQLAGVCLLVLFTCSPNIPVFAANLTFLLLCSDIHREGLAPALRRFGRAFGPTFLLALPYVCMVGAYSLAYGYPPRGHSDPIYDPELVSYLAPLTRTSLWSEQLGRLGAGGLDGVEPATYLGLVVLPLAVFGLWARRRDRHVAHLALVGLVFLVLSMGPKLQWQREIVEIGGWTVYLPFGLWRWVPLLGSVGQAGRYALIVYLAMGVGVACAVASLRDRVGARGALALPATIGLLICIDFAFESIATPLPKTLDLTETRPEYRRLLDPRLASPETMYQQTLCERPLIGGYVSRTPPRPLSLYRADPVLAWFFGEEAPAPSREALNQRLDELDVGDVLLAPDDPRGPVLATQGFHRRDSNAYTTVWSR